MNTRLVTIDLPLPGQPLAVVLAGLLASPGLQVWFDQTELRVGDSLRERLDEGLTRSRYGILILSKSFFAKRWPTRELNGFVQREIDGRKVILPVWHDVDEKVVREFSPILADRVALHWTAGMYSVAMDLINEIAPGIGAKLRERASTLVQLIPVKSGKQLAGIVGGADAFQFANEGAATHEESERVAAFLQGLQDWGDVWSELDVGEHVEAEFKMHQSLGTLLQAGWTVHGASAKRRINGGGQPLTMSVAILAVVKGTPPVVFVDGDSFIIPRVPST